MTKECGGRRFILIWVDSSTAPSSNCVMLRDVKPHMMKVRFQLFKSTKNVKVQLIQ